MAVGDPVRFYQNPRMTEIDPTTIIIPGTALAGGVVAGGTTVPPNTDVHVTLDAILGQVSEEYRGKSAYEIAVIDGFVGTEEQWLASLQGEPGPAIGVADAINSNVTNIAPSQHAVYQQMAMHVASPDAHPGYATDDDVINTMAIHVNQSDPHQQYRKKTEILDGGNF